MAKVFLTLFLAFLSCSPLFGQDLKCSPPNTGETTHWIGNLQSIIVERKPYRQLRGTVFTPLGEPLENALVEVFTNPEYLLAETNTGKKGSPEQKRIRACRTNADGQFVFSDLPDGKYELRSSSEDSATGWNATQIFVVVKSTGKKKEIRVEMSLGI